MARARGSRPSTNQSEAKAHSSLQQTGAQSLESQGEAGEDALDLTKEKASECVKEGDAQKRLSKKKPVLLRELPLTMGQSVAKEGKQSLLVEVKASRGGYEGDTGAIGRLNFKEMSDGGAFSLDLGGREHDARILPSRAMFVVSVGVEEAKIETVVSEYASLTNSRDALTAFGEGAVVHGDFDDSYRYYEGDVDVNRRVRMTDDDELGLPGSRPAKAAGKPKRGGRKKSTKAASNPSSKRQKKEAAAAATGADSTS